MTDIITVIAIVVYIMVAFLTLLIRLADHLTGEVVGTEIVKPAKPGTLTLRITVTSLAWPLLWAYLLIKENTGRTQ